MASVMWFRRDLRLADNPALTAAVADAAGDTHHADHTHHNDHPDAGVVPLFVLDPALWRPAGAPRRAYLTASLRDLGERVGGLQLRRGDPVEEVVSVARAARARTVHVAEDFGPYGRERDRRVEEALAEHDIALVRTGSPYAVSPGRIRNKSGNPYQVFTPFSKAWLDHGWPKPPDAPRDVRWVRPLKSHDHDEAPAPDGLHLPDAGEDAAWRRWHEFLEHDLARYGDDRNRPDLDRTSHLSVHLKWGEIHPRSLLAGLAQRRSKSAATFRSELAWREFYADVLFHRPETARDYLKPEFARMRYDDPADGFAAWRDGLTGFPIVDAGMRQLRAEGWMHNRVRMIVASFLAKDLHLEWQHGARHFMQWLVDGDLASNQHGWQWVAGSGTDAAPYFRIFNPTTQGRRFDPDGAYIRRFVPELRDVDDDAIHEPWKLDGGPPGGYPPPIVDHDEERREALHRYESIQG